MLLLCGWTFIGRAAGTPDPRQTFATFVSRVSGLLDATNRLTLSATVEITRADGLPRELLGQRIPTALQAPDRLRLNTRLNREELVIGRDGQELWAWYPSKKYGLLGAPGVAQYAGPTDASGASRLRPIALPLPQEQVNMAHLIFRTEALPDEVIDGVRCRAVHAELSTEAQLLLRSGPVEIDVALRETDQLPARILYHDGASLQLGLILHQVRLEKAWAPSRWKVPATKEGRVDRVALSHVRKYIPPIFQLLTTQAEPGAVNTPLQARND